MEYQADNSTVQTYTLACYRACAHCVAGTFKRSADNIFGCEDCECNPSGSIKDQCDERTGCRCRNLIGGAKCDKPTKLSYVPTFHQVSIQQHIGISIIRNDVI